ncbi:rhamnulokinase [Nocardioides zhouii]|uniref:Rhamnulokinase n=2 Tax=Nocardioides zhouii TaxID=1168729 RepID=A0A4Q2SNE7_9ACTN|nr:rhamnulokinase [Nocardioides zhouii]
MLGEVGHDHLRLRAAARFANGPVPAEDGLHWDVSALHRHALDGLRAAAAAALGGLVSVGIDSWAVDYGLLRDGRLLAEPFHYRDERRGEAGPRLVHERVPPAELYARTGLQHLPFNTLYQLEADTRLAEADRVLLVPDLLAYWLTGAEVAERTNASTTGLLSVTSGQWDDELIERLGLPPALLADLVDPGATIGTLLPEVGAAVGAPGLRVVAVGSHDTASAVVGVPLAGDDAAYISLGTWGLVGLELDAPVLTEAARAANFTHEGGVDGTIRFLTNVMGTWLLSETLRTWDRDDLRALLEAAADVTGPVTVFDVQDPRFVAPGDMPARIASWCAEHDVAAPADAASLVRSIVESLAAAYAEALQTAATLAGRPVRQVHVVGGGSQNTLLCQALADRTGLPVVAGPVEATALGNVLVQGRAAGAVTGGLAEMRELVRRTQDLRRHEPCSPR